MTGADARLIPQAPPRCSHRTPNTWQNRPSLSEFLGALALAIERGDLTYPDAPELIGELEAFRYELTAAGNVRYAAPSERYHDDCVMALALAWHAAAHTRPPAVRWLGC